MNFQLKLIEAEEVKSRVGKKRRKKLKVAQRRRSAREAKRENSKEVKKKKLKLVMITSIKKMYFAGVLIIPAVIVSNINHVVCAVTGNGDDELFRSDQTPSMGARAPEAIFSPEEAIRADAALGQERVVCMKLKEYIPGVSPELRSMKGKKLERFAN